MSSPMMTRMLGGGCCAAAASGDSMTAKAVQTKARARYGARMPMKAFTYPPSTFKLRAYRSHLNTDKDRGHRAADNNLSIHRVGSTARQRPHTNRLAVPCAGRRPQTTVA